MFEALSCSYSSICAGCDWLLKPEQEQRELKIAHLRDQWRDVFKEQNRLPEIGWSRVDRGALRDRVDLMVDNKSGTQRLGLFDRFKTGLVDLQGCPQMSAGLEAWFKEVRQIPIPVERGSLRLRVSPSGLKGIWLDLANIDIKRLLAERTTLDKLRSLGIVEIGQKRKRLVERNGVLKLDDPVLEPWFETYVQQGERERSVTRPVALYCTIGSFTQPGFRANQMLVQTVWDLTKDLNVGCSAEFGAGIGNFTLPLTSISKHVDVYEVDALALAGLRRTLDENNISDTVSIHTGNFQGPRKDPVDFNNVDLVLVDPPRSGLTNFLNPLGTVEKSSRPRFLIYISCFTESFVKDAARLLDWGYRISSISIVDQFPQSRHYETVARFELST